MSATRSGLVLATKVAVRRPCLTLYSKTARALNTASSHNMREVIAEREVPVSSYTPDGRGALSGSTQGQQYTIPVRKDPKVEVHAYDQEDRIVPLTQAAFERLPLTLQKMTVMGKVIIITG